LYISILEQNYNDFPPIVVSWEKSKAEALKLGGVLGFFRRKEGEGEFFFGSFF
jgi:hypothetical protein